MDLLLLTHRLPYAPNRGDRIRSYYLMRELSRFARVSLFSLVHDDDELAHAGTVPFASQVGTAFVPRLANLTRGALRLPTSRPLTHALLDAPNAHEVIRGLVARHPPDVVVAYCSGMARFAMEPPLADVPFVLDMVDVDSEKWSDLGNHAGQPRRWIYQREARTLAAFEVCAAERAQAVTVVTEREREALVALTTKASVHVVPNGVDVEAFAPSTPPAEAPIVVFSGMMDYSPNIDAVTWFADRVWPQVKLERPDARFVIVGARPVAAVQALATRDASIVVTGQVERVQPYLWDAAVAVAPIQMARGVQNKVLEALAAGVPAVVSEAVAAGLPPSVVERGCLVADDPEAFGHAVVSVLGRSAFSRRAMADAAEVGVLSWECQLAPIRRIVAPARRDAAVLDPARVS